MRTHSLSFSLQILLTASQSMLCMCACVCMFACMFMCVSMHMDPCVCVCVCMCMHMRVHVDWEFQVTTKWRTCLFKARSGEGLQGHVAIRGSKDDSFLLLLPHVAWFIAVQLCSLPCHPMLFAWICLWLHMAYLYHSSRIKVCFNLMPSRLL